MMKQLNGDEGVAQRLTTLAYSESDLNQSLPFVNDTMDRALLEIEAESVEKKT
jgi:hypothetical protein